VQPARQAHCGREIRMDGFLDEAAGRINAKLRVTSPDVV